MGKRRHLHVGAVRLAEPVELDAAITLWQQTPGIVLRAEDTAEQLQPRLLDGQLQLYVALDETVVIGALLTGCDGRRGYLYHLAVAEDVRGQGLGRALIEAAIEELGMQGVGRSHVFVVADNTLALQFWTHLGWQARSDLNVFSIDMDTSPHAD